MKKLFFTFIVFFSLSCYSQEQSKSPGNQSPTTQVFMGHVIKLNLTAEGRYSYEIIHQGKIIVNQKLNPFDLSPRGLASKEDACKVAQWQIQQLAAGAPSSVIVGQPLSAAIARQLNINID
jgi:hypothetical protein